MPAIDPDVVVCDFSTGANAVDSRHLVRKLRRRHRVMFLGHDDRVHGGADQAFSFERARKAGHHDNWFDFTQWCRGTVARLDRAALVLCSEQDAILFGDLVPAHRTLIALSPAWPPATGVEDLVGPGWVPDDPWDGIRALYYALQFHPGDEFDAVNCTSSTDLARLEAYALRHAAVVAVGSVDQLQSLAALGRDPTTSRFGHCVGGPPRRRSAAAPTTRSLVLVAGLEAGVRPLVPYLALLGAIPAGDRVFDEILVNAPTGWFRIEQREHVGMLMPTGAEPPATSRCVAAIAFPGLLRVLAPAFDTMARDIPMLLVPSARPHPMHEWSLAEARIEASRPDAVARLLADLVQTDSGLAARLLAVQRRVLRRHTMVDMTPGLLSGSGVAAR